MKNKKIVYLLLVLFIGLFCTIGIIKVNADSGWDSSYDSGGGSDYGGSDWSSSDWDSGSSGSSYSGNGNSSPASIIFAVIVFAVIFFIIYTKSKSTNTLGTGSESQDYQYTPISEEDVKAYIPDFNRNAFLDDVYNKFIEVQNAWTNFDYDKLRDLLSDELYNTYKMQLTSLKAKKQKNIMSDFEKVVCDITNVSAQNDVVTLNVVLEVSFFDYVVNNKDEVQRGSKDYKLLMTYDLTFVSTINKKKDNKCPSCGAELDETGVSDICPYCKSTIIKNSYNWVLAKKEAKAQRRL